MIPDSKFNFLIKRVIISLTIMNLRNKQYLNFPNKVLYKVYLTYSIANLKQFSMAVFK